MVSLVSRNEMLWVSPASAWRSQNKQGGSSDRRATFAAAVQMMSKLMNKIRYVGSMLWPLVAVDLAREG